ncbi:MAG: hypothetical protein LBP75_07095 [Planctomycetota bacterium]|jgi:hypothetical protein|nr:hypothetical protein [Planctomycetota bacterium]
MPVLQIDDCPADLYAELAANAAQEQHTAAEQVVILLREWLTRQSNRRERLALRLDGRERRRRLDELFTEIKKLPKPRNAELINDVAWLREDRSR